MESPTNPRADTVHWTRLALLLLGASLALVLPALASGFYWDDHYFRSPLIALEAPFGYYDFGDRLTGRGLAPWWTSPEFRVSFFRPLSSLTLHLDFAVLGGSPLAAHLHSALWFALLFWGALRLFRDLLSPRAARWAAVLFALSSVHALALGWIAARHTLVGGTLAIWSLVFYLRFRRGGGWHPALVAFALSGLGLLASESALAVAAVVAAHELAGAEDGWRRRLAAAAPFVGLAVAYFIAYKATGHGAFGSSVYADPLVRPGAFLAGLPQKALTVVGMYVFGVPGSLSYMPGLALVPAALGALALLLLGAGLALCWRDLDPPARRLIRWLGLAALLAAAPSMAALPQGRGLLPSSAVFFGLVGLLLVTLWSRRRPDGARRKLPVAIAFGLSAGLLVLSPLTRLGLSFVLFSGSQAQATLGKGSKLTCRPGSRVVLLNGDLMFAVAAPFVVAHHRGAFFRSWHQLTEAATDLQVARTGPDRLTISAKRGPLVHGFMLRLMRTDELTRGRVVQAGPIRARILAATAAGPTRVEFHLPGLDDPRRVCLLSYDGKAKVLRHATLPPAGAALTLPWHGPQL